VIGEVLFFEMALVGETLEFFALLHEAVFGLAFLLQICMQLVYGVAASRKEQILVAVLMVVV